MTTEFVREVKVRILEVMQAFLEAADNFAYETTRDVESQLGEYSGKDYDKGKLVAAVKLSINHLFMYFPTQFNSKQLKLISATAKAGFNQDTLLRVLKVTQEVALKMIDKTSEIRDGKEVCLIRNGHHFRQYIAAYTAERLAKEFNL